MTVQLVLVTSLFEAAAAAAATHDGVLGSPARQVLVLADLAPVPEIVAPLDAHPGAAAVLGEFESVVRLEDVIAPQHAGAWEVRPDDAPMLQRLIRAQWRLGTDEVELVLPAGVAAPATSLAAVFDDARLRMVAAGARAYVADWPKLDWPLGRRFLGMAYLDLAPGLAPQLLTRFGVPNQPFAPGRLRAILLGVGEGADLPPGSAVALAPSAGSAGQHGQFTAMLAAAREGGHDRVVVKPHPSGTPLRVDLLHRIADWAGVEVQLISDVRPVEALALTSRPAVVLGGASDAVLRTRALAGDCAVPVAAAAELTALEPYENPARPALVVAAALAGGGRFARPGELTALLRTVEFCRRPTHDHGALAEAERVVMSLTPDERARYFGESGLSRGGLRGGRS